MLKHIPMKKYLIWSFLFCSFQGLMAQSGEVTNAILALKDGILADAKTSIDKASVHEKTSIEPKTWLYKGKVYEAIALDPALGKQYPEAAKVAFESYQKAKELDATSAKPGKFKKDIEEAWSSNTFAVAVQNGGIVAFQNNKLGDAYDYFTMYQSVRPADTLGYVYAAQMALSQNEYKKAKESYEREIEKTGNISPDIVSNLNYIYKSIDSERDYNKALAIIQKGRAKYPNNTNFALQEIDLLEKTGRLPEAIANLEGTVKAGNPTIQNHLMLGSLYEKNNQLDKAKESYNAALAMNPNSFEANFNMGALIYNPAVEILKKTRDMSIAEYNKKGKNMDSQAKEVFKLALPYFEKAYSAKPEDADAKKTLKEIYYNLGMNEKAKSIQ
jgi:tetratricopeptide (TPR) repeat protein